MPFLSNSRLDGFFEEMKMGYPDVVVASGLATVYDRLMSLHILHSASFFAPLSVESGDTSPVDEKILIVKARELNSYLAKVSEGEGRMAKRARIASMLGVMNVIHRSPQEVKQYILNALTSCRDTREKTACTILLREMMTV